MGTGPGLLGATVTAAAGGGRGACPAMGPAPACGCPKAGFCGSGAACCPLCTSASHFCLRAFSAIATALGRAHGGRSTPLKKKRITHTSCAVHQPGEPPKLKRPRRRPLKRLRSVKNTRRNGGNGWQSSAFRKQAPRPPRSRAPCQGPSGCPPRRIGPAAQLLFVRCVHIS